ncbi:hypothetical protein DFH08DRAFT_1014738 [Mycena albidolilacea]|uniref:Uncharacterized protein n=1 Tax=Mycena albidolilacea TaxID=1033008 RepID=A0AAD7EN37_9AGAR|nr:hypothetical protein DFH08DRAFT_1014738 [Mycena albidolilacea]
MVAIYVYCPTCSLQIPVQLKCQGTIVAAHRGLYFQQCPRCQYFQWVDPPSVQEPKGDAFPRDPTIRSPSPASPQIDPSLFAEPTEQLPAYSDSLVNTAPAGLSPPLLSTAAKRIAVKQTTRAVPTLLTASQLPHADNSNSSALSHPPAVIPLPSTSLTPTTSTSASTLALDGPAIPTSTLPPKIYSKPMDPVWQAQYKVGLAVQQRKKEGEEGKSAEARRLQNEVQICFFSQTMKTRTFCASKTSLPYRISIYPKSLNLLCKMKLAPNDEISLLYLYGVLASFAALHSIEFWPHMPQPANLASWPASPHQNVVSMSVTLPVAFSKRHVQLGETPTMHAALVPRSASPLDLTCSLPSSLSSPQSRSRSLSVEVVVKPELMVDSIFIKPEPMIGGIDTGDLLWAHGCVLVPTGFGSWPAGIYARDMAWVFAKISIRHKAGSDVESRFWSVFSGVEYVKPTYQRQLQHWRASTQAERDATSNIPHNPTGLWNTWRQASSGQQKFDEKQGSKGKGSKRW